MYCTKLFEGLDKRLGEKKSLEEIGKELCDTVDDPRGKAIRLIKAHRGDEYLKDNANWLGYNIPHNKEGINEPKNFGSNESNEIALLIHTGEMNLPDDKGIQLYKDFTFKGQFNSIKIEPHIQKGYHYLNLINLGSGEEDTGYKEFLRQAINDNDLDYAIEKLYWIPSFINCNWETSITNRLKENPHWSWEQEKASWDRESQVEEMIK